MAAQRRPRRVRVERGLYRRGEEYFACATPQGSRRPAWRALGKVNLSTARRLRDAFVAEVKTKRVLDRHATFAQVAEDFIAHQRDLLRVGEIRPSTLVGHDGAVRLHLLPHFGRRAVHTITPNDLTGWHRMMQAKTGRGGGPLSQHTIRNAWITLRLVLGYAARHGYAAVNAADLLTKRERPKPGARRIRYLTSEEIDRLLAHSSERYRPAIAMAIFLGVRLAELLAIRWREVNFTDRLVAVTGQVSKGQRVEYAKTLAGHRDIVLFDGLATLLKAHKLRSPYSRDDAPVIASQLGNPMQPRNLAQRGLTAAATRAHLQPITFHVLRHTFASILIAQGNDPAYVAGQMGHERPSETLDTYAHLFDRARHAEQHRTKLNAQFGHLFHA